VTISSPYFRCFTVLFEDLWLFYKVLKCFMAVFGLFSCLMFHVMWNETWINGHVNENERRISLSKLNNNWNVFKWNKKNKSLASLSLFSLFRHILWVTKYNGFFKVFVSSHVDQRAQHVSHNASIFDEQSCLYFRLASSSKNSITLCLSLSP